MFESIFGISQSLGLTEPTSQSIRLPDTTSQYIGLPENISHSLGLPKNIFIFPILYTCFYLVLLFLHFVTLPRTVLIIYFHGGEIKRVGPQIHYK